MAEIGASLREARMRQRIDLAQMEAETKIRAKYLRALENEEWHVLPGPAYVKTFLRAYADRLGLDGRLLVEEYKLAHDRLSDTELRPISSRAGARARTRRPPRTIPRAWIVGIVVLALVAALYALGRTAEDDGGAGTTGDPGRALDAG
ncbi:MAG: helix-turn-helix domain-containing protein, partial [Actinomycetota bacterium]|nr:helix-turn-helix domain-containing protein [Actinomycetota bacterium]